MDYVSLTVTIYSETMHQDVLRKSFRRYEMQEGPAVFWGKSGTAFLGTLRTVSLPSSDSTCHFCQCAAQKTRNSLSREHLGTAQLREEGLRP